MLGTMLLEIALGQSVEARRSSIIVDGAPNARGTLTALRFVRDWLSAEGYMLTPKLHDAIVFCLDCSTNERFTLHEQRFRYMVIEKVLRPLFAELRTLRAPPPL